MLEKTEGVRNGFRHVSTDAVPLQNKREKAAGTACRVQPCVRLAEALAKIESIIS